MRLSGSATGTSIKQSGSYWGQVHLGTLSFHLSWSKFERMTKLDTSLIPV